jgi:hypothetical protein
MTMSDEADRFIATISALLERGDGFLEITGPDHEGRFPITSDYQITTETKRGTPVAGAADTLLLAAAAAMSHMTEMEEAEEDAE